MGPILNELSIGIIGGTGKEGFGLATRWVKSGFSVIIGSRSFEKAIQAAEKVRGVYPGAKVNGNTNEPTYKSAEIVSNKIGVKKKSLCFNAPSL